jgi:hypothetical protein
VLKVYDACNQLTAIQFLNEVRQRLPFRIHVIQPTMALSSNRSFTGMRKAPDIRHVYIRPRTPRLNGKVERSHRVDDQEFYQLLDRPASPTTSTCSITSCASGRTTTIIIIRMGCSMGKLHTSGSSPRREVKCHKGNGTLYMQSSWACAPTS